MVASSRRTLSSSRLDCSIRSRNRVGSIRKTPVVNDKGQIVPGQRMWLGLSCDHRVVDGAKGAAFLQTLKGLLEEPLRMLI